MLLSEKDNLEGYLCFLLKVSYETEESLKECYAILASEDSHFTPHNDLGSMKVIKKSLTFHLNIFRSIDCISGKISCSNPSVKFNDEQSCAKNENSFIDR